MDPLIIDRWLGHNGTTGCGSLEIYLSESIWGFPEFWCVKFDEQFFESLNFCWNDCRYSPTMHTAFSISLFLNTH